MDVLSLCWEYPPFVTGGLGVACFGINEALSRRPSVRLRVLTARCLLGARCPDAIAGAYDGAYANALDQATTFAQACERALDRVPDVIHAHDWMTFPAAFALQRRHGCAVVAHFHSTEVDRSGGQGDGSILSIEAAAYRQASEVVAVSRYTADLLHGLFGRREERGARVVHNAHDGPIELGRPLSLRARRAVFVGRLTHQKGLGALVGALRGVLARDPLATASIIGGGFLEAQMRAAIRQLGLEDRVRLEGTLDRGRIDALLDDARVLVMPSISEPFGLVALEAMARGVTVVASDRCGVAEANPHVITVAPRDLAGLETRIVHALAAGAETERLRSASAKALRSWRWDHAAQHIAGILSAAVPPLRGCRADMGADASSDLTWQPCT